ncbi:MAG: nucleotidyltransferase family protein [Thaumarchaeota archaeon]|nr:nucleotidyltransferase family protein [Nitrososphaerota archaeon]
MQKTKAVILAAGLGTRLRPYTYFLPKPMLPLGEKPVLEHLIEWLKQAQITDILISTSYLGKVIENYFQNGKELKVKITYTNSKRPMGTAGQLKSVEEQIDSTFVCLYGDSLFTFNLADALKYHHQNKAAATMTLMHYKTTLRYGFIEIDNKGKITGWREKPEVSGLINVGCYIMEPRFLKYIPKDKVYSMDKAFTEAMQTGEKILGYPVEGEFIDIGDKSSYRAAYDKYVQKLGKIL